MEKQEKRILILNTKESKELKVNKEVKMNKERKTLQHIGSKHPPILPLS